MGFWPFAWFNLRPFNPPFRHTIVWDGTAGLYPNEVSGIEDGILQNNLNA